ncbi:MAG TPA: carbamoyltransferase N-terminal domain-containing protein [Myxococcota bacterium]|nr:carbamoyltransferase N-terminal domain-containing protein [Myxococcota bacterium]HQK51253.1 carbamoyltransferase N-terminal domain-containing protein [Myxococcota bacterium]
MTVAGLSAFYHDSAACVAGNGGLLVAAQEERLDRVKGSAAFPGRALDACLQAAGITIMDVDEIAFYEKPFLKFERMLADHLRAFPFSYASFRRTMPAWLGERLVLPLVLRRNLGWERPVRFVTHHLAHAASAFLVSPFEEAAVLTVDGVGEWTTTAWGIGRGTSIEIREEIRYPDSLGLLYTAVTTWLGFEANRGEGKVMALGGFGRPVLLDRLRQVAGLRPDGSFRLDQSFFRFERGGVMWSPRFEREFGPPRVPGSDLGERYLDMAASLQALLEEAMLALARHVHERTGLRRLCMAGGVALNCAANGRILEETPFQEVFVQPAAGDAGAALGAAAVIRHCVHGLPREVVMRDAFLGPEYPVSRMRRALAARGLPTTEVPPEEMQRRVADRIASGAVVGWFQGRMEFGPRALGHRSILADPRNPAMKDILNARVKHREPFRPYGASVLAEETGAWFERDTESPFMLFAVRVRPEQRSRVPSALHVDGTCRHQTVTPESDPLYHGLIRQFHGLTGVPMVINTSFNDNNEPIVCTPEDAVACFLKNDLDVLALGPFLVEKGPPETASP